MGRALKIQKNNVGSGSTVTGSNPEVTTYNQTILTDAVFFTGHFTYTYLLIHCFTQVLRK